MRTPALAQKLSETLYKKRFFPYYVFNIVGGLDAQGKHRSLINTYQEMLPQFRNTKQVMNRQGRSILL